MASNSFKIELDDVAVKKKMQKLAKGVSDFQRPLDEIGTNMLDVYGNKVFESQGAKGDSWKGLSSGTLLARQNRWGYYKQTPVTKGKILIWTGNLMNGFVKNVSKVKLVVGNTVDYFKHHQKSQRKMLYLDKNVVDMIQTTLIKYLDKTIK